MAAYATQSDLSESFGDVELAQLTDEEAATTIDTVEVGKVCDETSSLIDTYLATRYTVPLDPVPTIVRKWARDIARAALWKDRADKESAVVRNADAAMAQIRDVAKGIAALPGVDGVVPESTGGFARTTPTAVFDTTGLLD